MGVRGKVRGRRTFATRPGRDQISSRDYRVYGLNTGLSFKKHCKCICISSPYNLFKVLFLEKTTNFLHPDKTIILQFKVLGLPITAFRPNPTAIFFNQHFCPSTVYRPPCTVICPKKKPPVRLFAERPSQKPIVKDIYSLDGARLTVHGGRFTVLGTRGMILRAP